MTRVCRITISSLGRSACVYNCVFCVAELDKVKITTEIFDKFTRLKSEKKRLASEAKGLRQQLAIAEAAGSAARGADAAGSEQQARQIGALREQVWGKEFAMAMAMAIARRVRSPSRRDNTTRHG